MNKPIRVMIVDDSAVVRAAFSEILKADPALSVLDMAVDPIFAMNKMTKEWPDVIVLDVDMPRMDGLTFLRKIMAERPTPTVICSSLAEKGSDLAFQAAELGAVEIIAKPKIGMKDFFTESAEMFREVIKAAAGADMRKVTALLRPDSQTIPLPPIGKRRDSPDGKKYIVMGASTGGTRALEVILTALPENTPGIAIVQHMPEGFTRKFAERLDKKSALNVREAQDGDELREGVCLIAPGNHHLQLREYKGKVIAEVRSGPRVNLHRPSVDVLFRSAARILGSAAVGVLLTGMGADGAAGMLEMKQNGARNIVQDEETSIVYGMPRSAWERGAAHASLPLQKIPGAILNASGFTQ